MINLTGISKNSARNLIGELTSEGLIISNPDSVDKRKNIYNLNWKYIVDKLKNPDNDFEIILDMMNLEDFKNYFVALQNFEVIDKDPSVTVLTHRLWDKLPSDEITIVPIGSPPEVFTIEFI
ncbi:MAG: hypothetical protein ACXAC7_22000 [Candidatus Hodarchaeales archaeon]